MRRQNRNTGKKEKTIVIASSALVLAALTMTGIYVKNNSEKEKNDGYNIDFSVLEEKEQDYIVQNKADEMQEQVEEEFWAVPEDDLDYAPMEDANSGMVEIPGATDGTAIDLYESLLNKESTEKEANLIDGEAETPDIVNGEAELAEDSTVQDGAEMTDAELEDAQDRAAMNADAVTQEIAEEPVVADFQPSTTLTWPVSGSVLIPYSMDKTVYFPTLQQYKYNPALVLAANEGDIISAVAAGRVTDVFYDEEIGNAVTVDIGNGYEVTYGQLKDIVVSKGASIEKSSVIGYVAAPTKYYSVEGTNAYFKLTLDDVPVNPLGELQ